jgi:hypothetical protein
MIPLISVRIRSDYTPTYEGSIDAGSKCCILTLPLSVTILRAVSVLGRVHV